MEHEEYGTRAAYVILSEEGAVVMNDCYNGFDEEARRHIQNFLQKHYMEKGEQKHLMEVKGCTLEVDGIGYFPDAPTERGVKHLHELAQAQQAGYRCAVAFVIQMEGITEVRPNVSTQPEFGTALAEAKAAGVRVLFLLCRVGRDSLEIVEQREG